MMVHIRNREGMRRSLMFGLLILLFPMAAAVPAFGGPFEDAVAAIEQGDYATAYRLLIPLAREGNPKAQYNLGLLYFRGEGVRRDPAEAARWYRKAAEQGDAPAQYNLGLLYDTGKGVSRDYAEAAKWYRRAAGQGDPDAQFNLGAMYARGEGVPRNSAEAAKWYRRAAGQGDPDAQFNLGVMYARGEGVPQDYVLAHMWYNLAATRYASSKAKRREESIKGRDLVASMMTPGQIAEAQRMAREWKPEKEGR